eukprot:scaffold110361_cov15-Tisochrysis_lutea.AAC.2
MLLPSYSRHICCASRGGLPHSALQQTQLLGSAADAEQQGAKAVAHGVAIAAPAESIGHAATVAFVATAFPKARPVRAAARAGAW